MSNRTILLIGSESVPGARARCFDQARIGDEVLRLTDVRAALEYLRQIDASASCEQSGIPALLFVWSGVGREALSQLLSSVRNEQRLVHTPIVVLTSTAEISQSSVADAAIPNEYVVRVGDTDTLLDVVSKHLDDGALTHRAQAC